MTEAVLDIKQWGNNLGVRLPVASEPMTLEQRLARFDPQRQGGEAMPTQEVGAERW